nr:radical SAM protein [uncultured Holophaga sp.]
MGLNELIINEIFLSIQGEGTRAGRPCLFIRTTGCPLRCVYCDTTYAFGEGLPMELEAILEEVLRRIGPPRRGPNAPFVELTGGEPLAQVASLRLMQALLDRGYEVALETAGSHDLASVPREVVKIADRKTPGSGMAERWLESNLDHLVSGQDELKFVLCGEEDYAWARDWCLERHLPERLHILFSPAWGRIDPRWLAEQIVADGLDVRFQLQLHKLVWPPEQRGV